MVDFDKALESFEKISGFKGALVINSKGDILHQFQKEEDRWNAILLLYKELAKHTQAISRLVNNTFREMYFEFEDGSITLENFQEDRVLIITASKDANLGKIRLEIRKMRSLE